LFTHFIFLELFVAVIYENFNNVQQSEITDEEALSLKRNDIKNFINTWAKFNPNGEHYMNTSCFYDFLKELDPPLGYKGIKIDKKNLNKVIFCMNIPDHIGKVYLPEVMWILFNSASGVNDEKVNNCEQVRTILKRLRRKYIDLSRNITLDSLCGYKYNKN
jgi:hypothetical protein